MVNAATPKTLEFTLPTELTAQQVVHEQIVAQILNAGGTSRDEFSIRLALEEALANAMKHGNRMQPEKKVHVKSTVHGSTVTIEVIDEGEGFSPEMIPDPTSDENLGRTSGRGVLLINSFMDEVTYNEKGNGVVMTKVLGDPSE